MENIDKTTTKHVQLTITAEGNYFPNLKVLSEYLGMNYQTVHSAVKRAKYSIKREFNGVMVEVQPYTQPKLSISVK